MKVPVYNLRNEITGEVELPEALFGLKWNHELISQVLRAQIANRRRPWAHAKGRGEVRGGGRKPWRQKGTGRARHGSIRSPLWVGGGKAHGPVKLRDYSQKINKRMRQRALLVGLSGRLREDAVKIFNNLSLEVPKTKALAETLRPLLGLNKRNKRFDVLFVAEAENRELRRASSNLEKTKVTAPQSLNLYDVLNYKRVFIDERALSAIGRGSTAEADRRPGA